MVRLGPKGRFSRAPSGSMRRPEVALPLINVVFLLLIFLLMVGTVREPIPESLAMAATRQAEDRPQASNTLILGADGSLRFRGRRISLEDLPSRLREARATNPVTEDRSAGMERLTIVADRRVPAERLLDLARLIAANGIEAIAIVTVRER